MKQVLQNMSNGKTELIEAPVPSVTENTLLINTTVSLISTGTERMLVDFGKAGLLSKARQQPDKVKQAMGKIQTDGLATTVEAVRSKLQKPLPLGYCNVGRVVEAGQSVEGFLPGDRVASNGPHADVVRVAKNLCAKIPDNVSDDAAAFTVAASIGLQGMRLAMPTLGESFVVSGVGLIGLLTVQLLRAQGCRVLATDFDQEKLALAKKYGAEICNLANGEDPVEAGSSFSRGKGVDGVIITASTKSSDPVSQAAKMCRQRGRIVLVGVTGLELSRADFYEKELTFQVSCSYGPGRYDPSYEDQSNDYPIGFVRWTQQRNFEAVLDMISSGYLDVTDLISKRFEFDAAPDAYAHLTTDKSALGILLDYGHEQETRHIKTVALAGSTARPSATAPVVGFVGAGNYASRMLIPAFKAGGAELHTIASSGGVSSVVHGRKLGFSRASTDTGALLENPAINTVAVVTRHNNHADITIKALENGKHVFVEKPLALNIEELDAVKAAYKSSTDKHLMVGFNRRFAPQVQTMKQLISKVLEPKTFVMVMNAGVIPADHWTQDPNIGGGRIIGEACHLIDLMRFLAGSQITSFDARKIATTSSMAVTEDKASITLGFEDGSHGTIHYFANGGATFPKERVEIFANGGTLQLNNFLKLKGYSWNGFSKQNLMRQDKGQNACSAAFLDAIKSGKPTPIKPDELFEVARVSIEVAEVLRAQK